MFQTSESCIKLHVVVVLELLLSEQCPLLQRCVCVCVCALGWVKCREHISLLVILCIIMYVKKKTLNRYPIMVKCLNISEPIYRSISSVYLVQNYAFVYFSLLPLLIEMSFVIYYLFISFVVDLACLV